MPQPPPAARKRLDRLGTYLGNLFKRGKCTDRNITTKVRGTLETVHFRRGADWYDGEHNG